jgi:hypothetical protein
MVKISLSTLLVVALTPVAAAFVAPPSRAFVARSPSTLKMETMDEKTVEPAGKLIPIKQETVQFTAGLIGAVAGFAVGGPVLGAIGAAIANYVSKLSDNEASTVIAAVSKSAIEIYNYLAKTDEKYELVTKAQTSLESALTKLKESNESIDPETIKKVEDALTGTSSKLKEINEEYDLVGAGMTALGVVGDLVDKAIQKAGELNEEYKLSEKALTAVKDAVDKAKNANV